MPDKARLAQEKLSHAHDLFCNDIIGEAEYNDAVVLLGWIVPNVSEI